MAAFSFTPRSLPPETLEQVFGYLTVREKARLSAVDKGWKAYFDSSSRLWRELDFGHPWHDYQNPLDVTATVQAYISRAKFDVRLLSIQNISRMRCNWLVTGLQHCSKLVELDLDCTDCSMWSLLNIAEVLPSLKRLNVVGRFSMHIPISFLENSLLLETASFGYSTREMGECYVGTGIISPHLKSLEFLDRYPNPDEDWLVLPSNIFDNAFNLEVLRIHGYIDFCPTNFRHLTNLQELQISYCGPGPIFCLPGNLRKLDISLFSLAEMLPDSLPELEVLTITHDNFNDHGHIIAAFESIGYKLKELHWRFEDGIDKNGMSYPTMDLPVINLMLRSGKTRNIKHLTMELLNSPNDRFLKAVAANFRQLEELTFLGTCRRITDADLQRFFEELPTLRKLGIPLMRHPGGDLLEWMMERKVSITNKPDTGFPYSTGDSEDESNEELEDTDEESDAESGDDLEYEFGEEVGDGAVN